MRSFVYTLGLIAESKHNKIEERYGIATLRERLATRKQQFSDGCGIVPMFRENTNDQTEGKRSEPPVRRRPRNAAALVSARRTADDRYEIWLRRGAVRRVYSARERRGGAQLPNADAECRGQRHRDHRGPERHGAAPGAAGLATGQCAAVWVLPERADYAGGGTAETETQADRRRD